MNVIERPLCIIPARGGSKRLPRKNILPLNGKPLLCYTIEAAIESNVFDTICVSSEDDEILAVAGKYQDVLPLKRNSNLATDTVRIIDLCRFLLNEFKSIKGLFREFGILLPTSPLRTAEDIDKAYGLFKNGDANAIMSITDFEHTPQTAVWAPDGYVRFFFDEKYLGIRQNMPKLYRHDGSIFFSKTDKFLHNPTQYGDKVLAYYMPPERAVDIDNPIDFEWAEFLLKRRSMKNE